MKRLLILCCCLLLCACGRSMGADSAAISIPAPPSPGTSAPVVEPPAENRVVHESETAYMSLVLPDDWAYEKTELCGVPTADDSDGTGSHATIISFWPTADPDCVAEFHALSEPYFLDCAVGLKLEERTFAEAGNAVVQTVGPENPYHLIHFSEADGRYIVMWHPTVEQYGKYGDAFWKIMETVAIGK